MPRLVVWFAYGLTDPRFSGPQAVRYIGITTNLNVRYGAHLSCPQNDPPEKNAWVQDVYAAGFEPGIEILEAFKTDSGDKIQARQHETHWIHHYESLGANLLNIQRENRDYPNDPVEQWIEQLIDQVYQSTGYNGLFLGGEPD